MRTKLTKEMTTQGGFYLTFTTTDPFYLARAEHADFQYGPFESKKEASRWSYKFVGGPYNKRIHGYFRTIVSADCADIFVPLYDEKDPDYAAEEYFRRQEEREIRKAHEDARRPGGPYCNCYICEPPGQRAAWYRFQEASRKLVEQQMKREEEKK